MKKMLKKSEVLREGYIKGLKHAKHIINEMMDNEDNPYAIIRGARIAGQRIKYGSSKFDKIMDMLDNTLMTAASELLDVYIKPIYKKKGTEGLRLAHENGAGIGWKYIGHGDIALVPTDGTVEVDGSVGFRVFDDVANDIDDEYLILDDDTSVFDVFGDWIDMDETLRTEILNQLHIVVR